MLNEPTLEKLIAMRMRAMADSWTQQQQSTEVADMDFDERFGLLVDAEHLDRQNRRRDRRVKAAKLRHSNACVEDFDDAKKRGLERSTLHRLATCGWIDEHLHVIITGPTGVGKTYLACALGPSAGGR